MERDGVAFLSAEHDQLRDLFARVSRPDEDRREVLKELMQVLNTHVALEGQVVAPALKNHVPGSEDMVQALHDNHHEVSQILTLIERRKVNSPDVPDMVNDLLEMTERHIAMSDREMFPRLRESLTPEQLEALGRELDSDDRHMLTHAHPAVPDSGPVADIAGRAAELVDRVRDRSHDINRTST